MVGDLTRRLPYRTVRRHSSSRVESSPVSIALHSVVTRYFSLNEATLRHDDDVCSSVSLSQTNVITNKENLKHGDHKQHVACWHLCDVFPSITTAVLWTMRRTNAAFPSSRHCFNIIRFILHALVMSLAHFPARTITPPPPRTFSPAVTAKI